MKREFDVMELAAAYVGPLVASGKYEKGGDFIQQSLVLARMVVKGLREEQLRVKELEKQFHELLKTSAGLDALKALATEARSRALAVAKNSLEYSGLVVEYHKAERVRYEAELELRQRFADENGVGADELMLPSPRMVHETS